MGRDRSKGKHGGRGGGVGKMYVENMDEVAIREDKINDARDSRIKRRGEDNEDESDSEVVHYFI